MSDANCQMHMFVLRLLGQNGPKKILPLVLSQGDGKKAPVVGSAFTQVTQAATFAKNGRGYKA